MIYLKMNALIKMKIKLSLIKNVAKSLKTLYLDKKQEKVHKEQFTLLKTKKKQSFMQSNKQRKSL